MSLHHAAAQFFQLKRCKERVLARTLRVYFYLHNNASFEHKQIVFLKLKNDNKLNLAEGRLAKFLKDLVLIEIFY